MVNRFGLSEEQERVLADILSADGTGFSALVRIAGLDPSIDFRGADLRGVDFGRSDLEGYDFSDADLSGSRLDRANLSGAIFANNLVEGTVWPSPPSGRRASRPVLRATTDFELRPFQREALSSIVAALEQGVARPVILMPPGTGKAILLQALLSEMDYRDMLGVALVYAPTQIAVEQLRQRFSHSFGTDAVAGGNSKEMLAPFDARLIVTAISSLRPEASRRLSARTYRGITHIFILDATLTRSRLRFLQEEYPGVPIVRFALPPPMAEEFRPPSIEDGEIVFVLSYGQAISDDLLEPAIIHSYRSPGSVEHGDQEEMRLIVSEVLEVVSSMPSGAIGGVICANTASVRKLARELNANIDAQRPGYSRIQRVVQHTSPSADESLVQAALDLQGTVLVLNEIVASRFDWSVLDYVIVLTRLRSPEQLAFVRRRRGHKRELQVIDFMQNFEWMVSTRG